MRDRVVPMRAVIAAALALSTMLLFTGVQTALAQEEHQHGFIEIAKNSDFDKAHGVRGGSGTAADPYVISGMTIDSLDIHDTSAHVVVKNNEIQNLTLNWIDAGVLVVDNTIGDLRVNENVERTGLPTSGRIAHNKIGVVGQLRHFDGIFENNVVDPAAGWLDDLPFFTEGPAVAFDGFNGAHFRNNTIHGPVRVQLHGHHHSTGFDGHSHQHSGSHDMDNMDHTKRWHQVFITDNVIYSDDYYALMYTDTAHSANDRTANSEENEELNKPHTHKTQVFLNNNKLVGSGLVVDVFNASDERHLGTKLGLVEIRNNRITMRALGDTEMFDYQAAGIDVSRATDVDLKITDNSIVGEVAEASATDAVRDQWEYSPGINLADVRKADVYLLDNLVANRSVGIEASRFKDVDWWIEGLDTRNVQTELSYDDSGKPPKRSP